MYLTHLSLTNFRTFTRLDIDLPRRILLLVGANAQGKTSLLEAVYYLATFTSFQAQYDRQLVSFLAGSESLSLARLVANYQRNERAHRLEARLIQETAGNGNVRFRKEILLDGVKKSPAEAMGHFNAVIFLPQMTRIFENGPEERRRYLNLAISQAMPGYAQALNEYNQALAQRNALLKQLAERGGDASQLCYWDEILSHKGAIIIQGRIKAIAEIEKLAVRIHHQLTHTQEVLRIIYQPAYDPLLPPEGQYSLQLQTTVLRNNFTINQIQQGFLERLTALRTEEIARGVTTCGPHRDEMRFLSNGIDLSDYGSRGQIRTVLLALKLAEVNWLKEKTGHWPVLLLDEILVELDTQRRADLLEYLGDCEQALLTTTDLKLFSDEFVQRSAIWEVAGGRVREAKKGAE